MRSLNEYIINECTINESIDGKMQYFCEMFAILLKGITFNTDSIQMMLNNLDLKTLQGMSEYFSKNDNSNYLSYEPNSDLFLKDENKKQITSQMSEYIVKYVASK